MVPDWLFSLLWLPQTMESSVFLRKNQWFALRTAEHTSPKSATWAGFVGPLALQVSVKSEHLAAAWAFKILATAMRAEQVAFFWGQSESTSICLIKLCENTKSSVLQWENSHFRPAMHSILEPISSTLRCKTALRTAFASDSSVVGASGALAKTV